MSWSEWTEKISKVLKGFITIKNQFTESGKITVNFLPINIGNRNVYTKLPDNFDVAGLKKVEFTAEVEKAIEERVTEKVRAMETRLRSLSEMEQYQILTNTTGTTITAFLKDRVGVPDELKIEIYPDPSAKKSE